MSAGAEAVLMCHRMLSLLSDSQQHMGIRCSANPAEKEATRPCRLVQHLEHMKAHTSGSVTLGFYSSSCMHDKRVLSGISVHPFNVS
jgi:hypothetical protein